MHTLTRDGVTLQMDIPAAGDPDWFCGAWETGVWEPDTLAIVDGFVKPYTTFIDIGAWCGAVTCWAARRKARVIAIEPDPVARQALYRTIDANGFADVDVVHGALWTHTGKCSITPDATGWGSSMTRTGDGEEIPCWSLPDLVEMMGAKDVSLVKMDIEGAECMVLEHAGPYLAAQKIPLLVALHEPWWSRPIDPAWLSGFTQIEGELSGFHSVLCLP